MARSGPSKYQPLADYLAAQPAAVGAVALTVAEVAAIVGAALPLGAWTRGWWKDTTDVRAGAWRRAGWRVEAVRLRTDPPTVTFTRADATAQPPTLPRP